MMHRSIQSLLTSEADREVARVVEVPNFTPEQIETISQTVFIASDPRPSDVMLIFGTSRGRWEEAARLYAEGYSPIIVASGLAGSAEMMGEKSQAAEIKESLVKMGVPSRAILEEDKSTNTLENVLYSKRLLEERGIVPESILYVAKAHHSGRCYLTLRHHFPGADLSVGSYPGVYDGLSIERDTWHADPRSAARVYGEYLRIMKYSERGDIARPAQ